MAKPQDLLMDGEVFDPDSPTPNIRKLRTYLDAAPKDEVFSVPKLCEAIGIGEHAIRKFVKSSKSAAYRHYAGGPNGNALWLGHPKAIELLKRKLAECVQ